MDKAVFIKKLRDIFLALNKTGKKYAKVWLSDADIEFGGLYQTGKYKLNLKSGGPLGIYKTEVRYAFDLLEKNLSPEENSYIYTLEIFDENEYASSDRDDIIIYSDEVAYNAA